MKRESYKGYDLVSGPQFHPKYPPFVTYIFLREKRRLFMWNKEGHTLEDSVKKAKNFIDNDLFLV